MLTNSLVRIQTETRQMEYQTDEINLLNSLAWAVGGIGMGDPMLKIKKCCEGVRVPPTPQKSEHENRVIWHSMRKKLSL